jgi:hypothetical protein
VSETDRLLQAALTDYLEAGVPDDLDLSADVQAKLARPRVRVVAGLGRKGPRRSWELVLIVPLLPLIVLLVPLILLGLCMSESEAPLRRSAAIGQGGIVGCGPLLVFVVILGGSLMAVVVHGAGQAGFAVGPLVLLLIPIAVLMGLIGVFLRADLLRPRW